MKSIKNKVFIEEFDQQYFTEDMDGEDDAQIIRACSKVPIENRKGLKEFVQQFVATRSHIDSWDLFRIIVACGKIPVESREDFKEFVETFCPQDIKDGEKIADYIKEAAYYYIPKSSGKSIVSSGKEEVED